MMPETERLRQVARETAQVIHERNRKQRQWVSIAVGVVVIAFTIGLTVQTVVQLNNANRLKRITTEQQAQTSALLCQMQIQGANDLTLIRKAFNHFGAQLGPLPGEKPVKCNPNPNDSTLERLERAMELSMTRRHP
jgi:hypothetical protein